MFNPNNRAFWMKKASKRTITGGESFSARRVLPCSVVFLKDTSASTTVRADSSASRGAAEEHQASAKILVPPQYAIARGDVVEIEGVLIEIVTIQPRRDTFGKIDHQEVDGNIRASV